MACYVVEVWNVKYLFNRVTMRPTPLHQSWSPAFTWSPVTLLITFAMDFHCCYLCCSWRSSRHTRCSPTMTTKFRHDVIMSNCCLVKLVWNMQQMIVLLLHTTDTHIAYFSVSIYLPHFLKLPQAGLGPPKRRIFGENCSKIFAGQMPFLSPNQKQYQSLKQTWTRKTTEWTTVLL